ncbi:spermidine/putrescine ABC transporter ATP-binding protein, partial [Rhizobium ruizarguesonis]
MSERFIAFEGVRKSYDGVSYVVRGLDLDVAKGEFLTLLGPSGSVKSFGRRQAYESPRGRNPRATVGGY